MPRIPRTTTVGSLKTYRYDINRSTYTMNQSMNKVITQRNFNSFAEDPTAASRAFQLRRSYLKTSSQATLNTSVYSKYQQAWSALDSVSQDVDTIARDTAFGSILTALNDPDGSGRNALGQSMVAKADSIIQSMNGRYGENFIFSGADTLNVPFTWTENVNAKYIETPDATKPEHAAAFIYEKKGGGLTNDVKEAAMTPKPNPEYDKDEAAANPGTYEVKPYLNAAGEPEDDPDKADQVLVENKAYDPMTKYKYIQADGKTGTDDESKAGRILCYRGVRMDTDMNGSTLDAQKMGYFINQEKKYMDIGIGHKEMDGEVVPTSVFDSALQGAFYLGGSGTSTQTVTIRGETRTIEVPNDIVSIIDQMGHVLLRCDPDDGHYNNDDGNDNDEFYALALARQFEDQAKVVKQRYDELDTRSSFLRDNGELLISQADTLADQFLGLEDIDPAAAISDFMYAKYCYDTALKVGNSILSQSLMDYLNL